MGAGPADPGAASIVPPEIPGTPARVRTPRRIWRMLAATALAWIIGFLATTPMQISNLVKDAAGDEHLLLDSLSHGLIVWAVITLGLSLIFVLLLLGPLATLISARWVVTHPRTAVATLPVLVAVPLAHRLWDWHLDVPGPYTTPSPIYMDYTIFILLFFAVASIMYLWLLRRATGRAATQR